MEMPDFDPNDVVIDRYEDMTKEQLIECLNAADAHHQEHHQWQEALKRENEELKAKLDKAKNALEQISRMSPLPDHKSNTMTLVACREIAGIALGNKSIVHALRKHKAMNSIYPDAPEQP